MASIYDIAPSNDFGAWSNSVNNYNPLNTNGSSTGGILNLGSILPKTNYGLSPSQGLTSNTLGGGLGIKLGSGGAPSLGMGKNTGGFFGNGNGFGFNLDTANFAMNGLSGIMQLWAANTQRKAIQAQMDIAKENMRMTKLGYDTNIEKRAMAAANFNGYGSEGMRTAGNAALGRYGSGLLQPRELAPAKRNDEPVAATA